MIATVLPFPTAYARAMRALDVPKMRDSLNACADELVDVGDLSESGAPEHLVAARANLLAAISMALTALDTIDGGSTVLQAAE